METPNTQPGTGSTPSLRGQNRRRFMRRTPASTSSRRGQAKRAQAEITAIDGLKAARQNIERMLVDLKTTRDAQVARAKADIDAAIVAFQASLEDFRRKFTTPSEKK